MAQVFLTYTGGETYAKFAPSIVLSPSFSKYRLQLGSEIPIDAPENTALTLSLWREFCGICLSPNNDAIPPRIQWQRSR